MRAAMNAVLYLLRTGCPWRYLPRDSFPPRSTVYNIFRKFQRDGVWEAIWAERHMALRERMLERTFSRFGRNRRLAKDFRKPRRNPGHLRYPRLHPACPQAPCQGVGLNSTNHGWQRTMTKVGKSDGEGTFSWATPSSTRRHFTPASPIPRSVP
jgi:transposase